MNIKIPKYSLSEELINSISHGVGGIFSIVGLILMLIRCSTALEYVCISIYGTTMILLYIMSCIYHALSPRITGKKVLRVLDHCNVYLLVLGTYIPISLLGVKGVLGWVLFGIVCSITILGIVLSSINMDKLQVFEVICHLINGWSVLIGIKSLYKNIGIGILFLILGGLMYSIGAILYGIGAKKKYMHSVFHFFCLFGSLFHFMAIYNHVI
ncbi:MAG: hemolysin III family protein [Bacilli bacterium]